MRRCWFAWPDPFLLKVASDPLVSGIFQAPLFQGNLGNPCPRVASNHFVPGPFLTRVTPFEALVCSPLAWWPSLVASLPFANPYQLHYKTPIKRIPPLSSGGNYCVELMGIDQTFYYYCTLNTSCSSLNVRAGSEGVRWVRYSCVISKHRREGFPLFLQR